MKHDELLTIAEGAEKLKEFDENLLDFDGDSLQNLHRTDEGEYLITLKGERREPIPFTMRGLRAFRTATTLPFQFLDEVDSGSELFGEVAQHCFRRIEQPHRFVLRQGEINGVIDREKPFVTAREAYDAVAGRLPETTRVANIAVGKELAVEFLLDEAKAPPSRVGDFSHSGLELVLADGLPRLSAFIYRLRCTNGMIGKEHMPRRVSDTRRQDLIDSIENGVSDILDAAQLMLDRFLHSDEIKVEDPKIALNDLIRTNKLPGYMSQVLLDRLASSLYDPTRPAGRDFTSYYDFINLITNAANEYRGTYHRRYRRLVQIGGTITHESTSHHCNTCGHSMN